MKFNIKSILLFIWNNFIWLAVLLFVVDLVSKQIVLNTMTVGQSIPLIGNFLEIEYVINDGAAFGIQFKDPLINQIIWIIVSLLGSVILIGVFVKKHNKMNKYVIASLMLMISGCLGNLIDRAFYSSEYLNYSTNGVVDFIGVNFGSWPFPRFNVADSCLVIGTIMLIIWLFITEAQELRESKKVEETKTNEKILSKDEIEMNKHANPNKDDAE